MNDSSLNLGNAKTSLRAMGASRRPVLITLQWLLWIGTLVVFGLLAGWYNLAIPLGEGPDEPGHVEFAWWLARENRLPNVAQGEAQGEGHQPPLAYLLLQPAARSVALEDRVVRLQANPEWLWAGGNQAAAFQRRSVDRWPFMADARSWHLMRLISTLASVVTLGATWLSARWLGLGWWTAWGAMALLAFWPQFVFHSALVSNDPFVWMWISLLVAWLVVPRPGRWWGLGTGILLAAALLTKQNAVVAVPLIAAAVWLRRQQLTSLAWHLTTLLGSTLVLAGWWYARNLLLYGDLFGLSTYTATFGSATFDPLNSSLVATALKDLGTSLVARFGWMTILAPGWVYGSVGLIIAASLTGLWRKRHELRGLWLLLAVLLGSTLVWVGAFGMISGMVAWQGRFMLPACSALAISLAAGLERVLPQRLALAASLIVLLTISLLLPTLALKPVYPTKTIAAQPEQPILARWDPDHSAAFELRVLDLPSTVQAGSVLTIETVWHTTGSQDRAWSLFWHLAQPGEKYESYAFDVPPSFPATQWTKDDWWQETIQLPVPAELAPGSYDLRLGWFDQSGTQERAAVRAEDGTLLGNYVTLQRITVSP